MIRLALWTHVAGRASTARTVCRGRGWPSWPRGFAEVQAEVRRRRAAGEYGFYSLVDQGDTVREITTFAEGLGQAHDHVLVLGIGGSALGTKALLNALRRPAWNELDDEGREFFPRLTVLENVDPTTVAAALRADRSAPGAGQRDQQVGRHGRDDGAVPGGPRVAGGCARRGGVTATSCSPPIPARGALRELAGRDGIATLERAARRRRPVQRALAGGPAAGGAGGHRHRRRCWPGPGRRWSGPRPTTCCRIRPRSTPRSTGRPTPSSGARIHVLMPYTDRLREFAEWYRQLWAESLGKRVDRRGQGGAHRAHAGRRRSAPPTSTARCSSSWRGRTTRSSPSSRWTISARTCTIPAAAPGAFRADLAYLPGPHAGRAAPGRVRGDLRGAGPDGADELHPAASRISSAATLGEAIMFFQLATGYAGVWYGIDPFDQPGVELGKQLTYAAMGRPGYEPHRQRRGAADERRSQP